MSERKLPTCKEGKSKKCGRACIPILRNCKADGTKDRVRGPRKPRREPVCTPGVSRKCGKTCASVRRRCKVPGFEYVPPPTKTELYRLKCAEELKRVQDGHRQAELDYDEFVDQLGASGTSDGNYICRGDMEVGDL